MASGQPLCLFQDWEAPGWNSPDAGPEGVGQFNPRSMPDVQGSFVDAAHLDISPTWLLGTPELAYATDPWQDTPMCRSVNIKVSNLSFGDLKALANTVQSDDALIVLPSPSCIGR